MNILLIEGVISAIITPFTSDGKVDTDGLQFLTQRLIESGVDGVCCLGSTGEFQKLTREERQLIIKTVIDEAKDRLSIIVGTGGVTTRDAIQYTMDAKDLGATAALVLPPWFFSYTSETLIDHYRAITEAVDFPVILYNIPSVGYLLPPDVVIKTSQMQNIIGIKDSSSSILYYQNIINQTSKEFNVIQGYGSLFFPSLLLGGRATISGESNIAPRILVDLYQKFLQNDYAGAREQHYKLVDIIDVILFGTYPAAIKEAMTMMGLPGGSIIPPMSPLTDEERQKLRKILVKLHLIKE